MFKHYVIFIWIDTSADIALNENYIGFEHFLQNLELVSDFEWIDLGDLGSDWPRIFSGVKIVSCIVWEILI